MHDDHDAHPARSSRETRFRFAALALIGLAMIAFIAISPTIYRVFGEGWMSPPIFASGLLTIIAAKIAPSVPVRWGLVLILAMALIMRLLLVGEQPMLSTDIYRYVWDGRVQGAGVNPYAYVPADPRLEALREPHVYPNINRVDYAVTIYPPVAQFYFFLVTRISETITFMRLAMVACEVVTVLVIIDLLRRFNLPVTAVVAYAWHPLAIWEVANNGHVDALMIALMMIGIWLLVRARPLAGVVGIAVAALAKPYAVVILPALWRPWDWRAPAVFVATIAICYLPYLGVGRGVLGFLTTGYLTEEGVASGEGFWFVMILNFLFGERPAFVVIYGVALLGVMGWLAFNAVFDRDQTPQRKVAHIATLLMAGLLFLSPNYPWYFLVVVPFIMLGGGLPAWTMTLFALLLYRPVYLPYNDLIWKSVVLLPFLIAVVVSATRRRSAAFTSNMPVG